MDTKLKINVFDPSFIMLIDDTPANCLEFSLSWGEVGLKPQKRSN